MGFLTSELTLETTEQYSCRVAKVFGGSLASSPNSVVNIATAKVLRHSFRETSRPDMTLSTAVSISAENTIDELSSADAINRARAARARVVNEDSN